MGINFIGFIEHTHPQHTTGKLYYVWMAINHSLQWKISPNCEDGQQIQMAKMSEQVQPWQLENTDAQYWSNIAYELEDIMAMFAHKFRGPLQSIQYNVEHDNHKKRTIEAVQTMTELLKIFSLISSDAETLRQKILQDKKGKGTLATVLVKSLSQAITQLLTVNNMDRIVQHYLAYAKKKAQIPSTATREQLMDDYLDVWENLQAEWENSFMQLVADDLICLTAFLQERFFPIQIVGVNDNLIHFKPYGATESVFIIVMTEIFLNTVKYYSSVTAEPVIVRWESQPEICKLVCENPTTQIERGSPKGSHKGHLFLKAIARKLQGNFTATLVQNHYKAEFSLPRHLLMGDI
jgi:signal transduction histidine kinase